MSVLKANRVESDFKVITQAIEIRRDLTTYVAGDRNKEDIENMYRSWIGSYKKVMSRQQLENMNQLYSQLFEGV